MFAARRALPIVLAVVALGGLLAVPMTASGAGKNSTRIVLSLKFPAFHGKLTSPRKACLGSRKMKMYRERGGRKTVLGRATSADNGKWKIPVKKLRPGSYYATVAPRGKCKAAKSKVVSFN